MSSGQTQQRRPHLIFVTCCATKQKRVSLLGKWGHWAFLSTRSTPFWSSMVMMESWKYESTPKRRNGAGAGPAPFVKRNGGRSPPTTNRGVAGFPSGPDGAPSSVPGRLCGQSFQADSLHQNLGSWRVRFFDKSHDESARVSTGLYQHAAARQQTVALIVPRQEIGLGSFTELRSGLQICSQSLPSGRPRHCKRSTERKVPAPGSGMPDLCVTQVAGPHSSCIPLLGGVATATWCCCLHCKKSINY